MLTSGNVALFAVILVIEAVLLTLLLRRIDGPETVVQNRDLSRLEYIDLESVIVPVRHGKPGSEINLTVRVDASILVTGSTSDRARARDQVRALAPKIADEIARTVGEQTADQAVDPGNRERIKDRLRAALNQSVFRENMVQEVVFRYYGP